MVNAKKIKVKINSVSNIQQITKALEIVATVKLQKNKEMTENYRDFMVDFLTILQTISKKVNIFEDLDNRKKTWKDLVIVVSSDKWLCWSLNSKLFKKIFNKFEENKNNVDVFCIWKKSLEFFSRSWFNIVWDIELKDSFEEKDLEVLFAEIRYSFESLKYDNIFLPFNFFKSIMTQIPMILQLYPLNKDSFSELMWEIDLSDDVLDNSNIIKKDVMLEPWEKELADELKKQLLQHMIYGAVLQNKTWEFASRMLAMKNAKDNSDSMIKNLLLSFNKARQWAITQEISEIVWAKMAIENIK